MAEEDKIESTTPSTPAPAAAPVPTGVESTGGSGDVPEEIKGWNWGAFFLNWIWSIFNKVWIGLLALVLPFIPVVGGIGVLVMAIVLGLKGSEWAWKSRKFESVEQFKKVQKAWAIWGLVIFVIGIVIMVSTWSIVAGMLFGSGASLDY